MGSGAFLWGSLSDRFGTRAVVLMRRRHPWHRPGLAPARRQRCWQFQLLFGVLVGLAAGSFYAPLIATVTRWFTANRSLAVALVSSGMGIGTLVIAPLSRWIITRYDWRTALLAIGGLAWLVVLPAALLVRRPPAAHCRRPQRPRRRQP